MKILTLTVPGFSATFLCACMIGLYGCDLSPEASAAITKPAPVADITASTIPGEKPSGKPANAATILARPEVPILCYHQIRDWKPTDSKTAREYIVPVDAFKAQMKMLADSGYHTVSPDQLYNYLAYGTSLPHKPILLTFDDTDLDQYTVAWPEMKKYGYKGVFFVMTVSLGRPRYMNREQVKELSDAGNSIGSHTWDHHNVKKYQEEDWVTQIEKPSKQLETITGKPVEYFAFPFGLWNAPAIPELKKRSIKAAFQLYGPRDQQDPLYTIRRIIVPGSWSPATLHARMRSAFMPAKMPG